MEWEITSYADLRSGIQLLCNCSLSLQQQKTSEIQYYLLTYTYPNYNITILFLNDKNFNKRNRKKIRIKLSRCCINGSFNCFLRCEKETRRFVFLPFGYALENLSPIVAGKQFAKKIQKQTHDNFSVFLCYLACGVTGEKNILSLKENPRNYYKDKREN